MVVSYETQSGETLSFLVYAALQSLLASQETCLTSPLLNFSLRLSLAVGNDNP